MASGDLYGLTVMTAGSSETSVCTASHARIMNVFVLVDLSKVLESTLVATIRVGLYLD